MANTKISALTSATTPLTGSEIVPVNQSGVTDSVSVANLTAGRAVSAASLTTTGTVVGGDQISTAKGFEARGTMASYYSTGGMAMFSDTAGTGYLKTYANSSGTGGLAINFQVSNTNVATVNTADVLANIGNFVPSTAGKGINFTANTPASGMTSQNLTWYEEGTISATVTAGSGSGYTTAVYFAKYTRVGRLVTVGFNVQVTAAGTASGAMTISGLPFTSTSTIIPSCSVYEQVSGTMYMARVPAGGTTVVVTTTLGLGVNWAYGTQYNIFLTYEV